MKWQTAAIPCLAAMALACGQRHDSNPQSGLGAGASANSTATSPDTALRTPGAADSAGSMGAPVPGAGDSGLKGNWDSTRYHKRVTNQDQSGVTRKRKSTLGPNVTKTRPDQGQPVTGKGDTLNRSLDSVHHDRTVGVRHHCHLWGSPQLSKQRINFRTGHCFACFVKSPRPFFQDIMILENAPDHGKDSSRRGRHQQ